MNQNALPSSFARYFWGDDITRLDSLKHKRYILTTLLEHGDTEAIRWLVTTYGKGPVKEILPTLRLSTKSSNFWHHHL